MRQQPGAVGKAVAKAWGSVFPCTAVGFNRTTKVHWDSKGFRNGLDVIGVLGCFTGGNLKFQDINVTLEWGSGTLAAFDGYDLVHEEFKLERPQAAIIGLGTKTGRVKGQPQEIGAG
ncbi:hypothetical protein FRC10_009725 [Ceratobasidium sp. 414]|nr:hypothetical protein FRC10_009725 [Ceratobasidium sp. 414]